MVTWKRPLQDGTGHAHAKSFSLVLALLLLSATPTARATVLEVLTPSSVFVQTAIGDQRTDAYTLGLTWDWAWRQQTRAGALTGYFETAVGRWSSDSGGQSGTTWVTQLGATPVFRLYPSQRWFVEAGIGANYIVPIYQSETKRFSTKFNFGDHLAFGMEFGQSRRYEAALRVQHFSNAGIDTPNPGENFVELRFSSRIDAARRLKPR